MDKVELVVRGNNILFWDYSDAEVSKVLQLMKMIINKSTSIISFSLAYPGVIVLSIFPYFSPGFSWYSHMTCYAF